MTGNLLLQRLPADAQAVLGPRLTPVNLRADTELHAAQRVAQQLYFPTTAVLALRHEPEPGQTLVAALIDRCGMAGTSALLGADATQAVVLVAGQALRLDAGHLQGEFERSAAVRQRLLGWVQVVISQVVQTAACQRFHSPEQRLCLRLAQLAHGRDEPVIALTQRQLGELVGARRERVNELLGQLQDQGLLSQRRGQIDLRDQPAIAQRACSCHGHWLQTLARAGAAPT